MKKRKPLSLKRLYTFAAMLLSERMKKEKDLKKINGEMHIIRDYLKFVSEKKDIEIT